MIIVKVSENRIENAIKMEELYNLLFKKNYKISLNKESIKGVKTDLATSISIVALGVSTVGTLYPIIKDLQNWMRPKNYTLTITDENIKTTATNLTENEYLKLIEKLNQKKIQLEIS